MTVLPAYVNSVFLMVIAMLIAVTHYPIQRTSQYLFSISAMIACHEALIQFADQNPNSVGTIPAASVDAFLPPGIGDPGLFTYVVQAPGTAATYLTAPSLTQGTIILMVQRLSVYAITAGAVIGGNIVPALPATPVAAIAGVPNNTIAIQSPLRG
jgi:hypothetical protein